MKFMKEKKDDISLLKKYFTDDGAKFAEVHLRELIKLFQKTNEYPISFEGIFGVKKHKFVTEVQTEQELFGRIKMLMTMMGINKIDIPNYGTFELRGKQ